MPKIQRVASAAQAALIAFSLAAASSAAFAEDFGKPGEKVSLTVGYQPYDVWIEIEQELSYDRS